jgi:cell division protein FtsB
MPPARSASAAPRRAPRTTPGRQPRPKPRKVILPSSVLRVRWDRAGRIGLLFVLLVVVGLYAEHALSYFSTRTQSDQQNAIVTALSSQNRGLERQLKALNDPRTIVRDARALGMIRPGERSYAITGQAQH